MSLATIVPVDSVVPAAGDRRAYFIDRLYALWWVMIVDGLDVERARAIQARLLVGLAEVDGHRVGPR